MIEKNGYIKIGINKYEYENTNNKKYLLLNIENINNFQKIIINKFLNNFIYIENLDCFDGNIQDMIKLIINTYLEYN